MASVISGIFENARFALSSLGVLDSLFLLFVSSVQVNLPDGGVAFGNKTQLQNTSSPVAVVKQCETFMVQNHLRGESYGYNYSFNKPSNYKYSPSQWLWDSGAHQISWVALGRPDLAIDDMRSQLNFLLKDGRIPEQINWYAQEWSLVDSFKTRFLYSRIDYNDLTQMPVLPYSLRSIYTATEDTEVLKEFLPKIVDYFRWWKRTRCLDGQALVTILHPWESGLDLTPAYDPALGLPLEKRARPLWSDLYPRLLRLILAYKHWYRWDQRRILASEAPRIKGLATFKVQDIAVNSVYASGWGVLGELASTFDRDLAEECYENQAYFEQGILTDLWDEEEQRFVTGYKSPKDGSQRYHSVKTVQTLFPLLLNSIPDSQVDRIVQLLTNESEFWLPAAVPSVSKAESEYKPVWNTDLLWRGPMWGFPNWFIMEGLQKQGCLTVLSELMDKWIWTVQTGGIWEMYNPETAVGYGAEGLGMSVLIVDWIRRLGRV